MSDKDSQLVGNQDAAARAETKAANEQAKTERVRRNWFKKNVGPNSGYSNSYTPTFSRAAQGLGTQVNKAKVSLGVAFSDPGFQIFILGLIWWGIDRLLGLNQAHITVSFIFLLLAVFRINKSEGLFVTAGLYIWLVIYQMTFDLATLGSILCLTVLAAFLWGKFFKKLANNQILRSAAKGILPAILFFISVGGFESLALRFFDVAIPDVMVQALIWTPFWAYYGLTKTQINHPLVGFGYFLAIINILALVGGGVFGGVLTDSETGDFDLNQALQDRRSLVDSGQASPILKAVVGAWCQVKNAGSVDSSQKCEKEIKEYEVEKKCEANKQVVNGDQSVQECVKQVQEEQDQDKAAAKGSNDNTLEPIEYEWVFNSKAIKEAFPTMVKTSTPKVQGSFTISGLKQEALAEFNCKWVAKGQEVIGTVSAKTTGIDPQSGAAQVRLAKDKNNKVQVTCELDKSRLFDRGQVEFGVKLFNLRTYSYLTRAFLGDVTDEEKEQLIKEIKPTYFSSKSDVNSFSPDEDLAHLDFQFGALTVSEPYIAASDPVTMVITIRDDGYKKGKKSGLVSVHEYYIDMSQYGLTFQNGEGCFGSQNPQIETKNSVALSKVCDVILPADLKNLPSYQPFVIDVYEGYLEYDYYLAHAISGITLPKKPVEPREALQNENNAVGATT